MTSSIELAAQPDREALVSPRDMVRSGLCIGCGICVAQSGCSETRMRLDRYGQFKPSGSTEWMRERTHAFSITCPFSPGALTEDDLADGRFPKASRNSAGIGRFEAAYVGHVVEEDFRARGSSGGLVTWMACELLRRGLVDGVAHVAATESDDGGAKFFGYKISGTEEDIRAAAKSRYYPVELASVVRQIRSTPGRYAVVGIPCFIKSLRLLMNQDAVIRERLAFTLGLFCGHMKSARMVESFAWQMGVDTAAVRAVEFRLKDPERPANWYTAQLTLKDGSTPARDWWHLVDGDWGAGFFQNSACNFCDDVVAETADVSFGDAWVEPYSSDGRGTNVIIVRSPVVHELIASAISEGRLVLTPVDSQFVEQTQAAGLRQRREGLAFRLLWPRFGVRPRKRVAPDARGLPFRRKLIYVMRHQISAWSHRMFWLARVMNSPVVYTGWARAVLTLYHGVAYSRGRVGGIVERLKLRGGEG